MWLLQNIQVHALSSPCRYIYIYTYTQIYIYVPCKYIYNLIYDLYDICI